MPLEFLKVVRVETYADTSVRLVLENGHSVWVKRMASHSVMHIDPVPKAPEHGHGIDVKQLPNSGSTTF